MPKTENAILKNLSYALKTTSRKFYEISSRFYESNLIFLFIE